MSLEVIPTSYFLILLYLVEGITPIGGQEGRWYPQAKLRGLLRKAAVDTCGVVIVIALLMGGFIEKTDLKPTLNAGTLLCRGTCLAWLSQYGKQPQEAGFCSKPMDAEHPTSLTAQSAGLTVQEATPAEGGPAVQKLPAAKLFGAAKSQLKKARAVQSSTGGPVQPRY